MVLHVDDGSPAVAAVVAVVMIAGAALELELGGDGVTLLLEQLPPANVPDHSHPCNLDVRLCTLFNYTLTRISIYPPFEDDWITRCRRVLSPHGRESRDQEKEAAMI